MTYALVGCNCMFSCCKRSGSEEGEACPRVVHGGVLSCY